MANDTPNRYRVSRKLTLLKIVVYFGLISLGYSLIVKLSSTNVTLDIWLGLIGSIILFSLLLFFLNTRKTIEYDDIKHILYVLDSKGKLIYEVPVEKIDKILFSSMGFDKLGSQYKIVFRDFHNQKRTVNFFSIPLRKDVNTIIVDTKLKNPNLVTRNWNIV